jgi:AcrR family transcriptional regulator
MPKPSPTRDRLIESARYLFWERGFAGTSMADLLNHAEVNSGSFYHFFESKEALLRAVLETYRAGLRPMIVDPAFAKSEEPVTRIFAILAGYRERILQTKCQYGCPLGRLALEIDPENRPAHALIAENFRGWIAAVRECVDQLKGRLPEGNRSRGAGNLCFGGDGRWGDALSILRLGRAVRSHCVPIAEPFSSASCAAEVVKLGARSAQFGAVSEARP